MKNTPKWEITFESGDYNARDVPKKLVLYDLGSLDADVKKVTDNTIRTINSLKAITLFLGSTLTEYTVNAKIKPPSGAPSGKFYLIWAGIDPEIVSEWGITVQEGDDTYDIKGLFCKKKKGEYALVAIRADEHQMKNTVKHLKDIAALVLNEPKKVRYTKIFRLNTGLRSKTL